MFLQAVMLLGAAAGAIPVIVHLISRRHSRVMPWAAMHLLEPLLTTQRRRSTLEQWLLLAIRSAIPVLLALGMAGPVLTGSQGFATSGPMSVVILLDASFSMSAGQTGATVFDQARSQAAEVLRDLPAGSEAAVLIMAGTGASQKVDSLTDRPTSNLDLLSQRLQGVQPVRGVSDLATSVQAAVALAGSMRHPQRQVLVLSDFQQVNLPPQATQAAVLTPSGPESERAKTANSTLKPEILLWPLQHASLSNLAVGRIQVEPAVVTPRREVHFQSHLQNHGQSPRQDVRFQWLVNGEVKAASTASVSGNESSVVSFKHTFEQPGDYRVELVCEDDSLKADNLSQTIVTVQERVPVLLLAGSAGAAAMQGDADYLQLALAPMASSGGPSDADLFSPSVLLAAQATPEAIKRARVVVLANVATLSEPCVQSLAEHVRAGGGLLIFPGRNTDVKWHHEVLGKAGLLPMTLGELRGGLAQDAARSALTPETWSHPAMAMFNDRTQGDLSPVSLKRWFELRPWPQQQAGVLTSAARLTTGEPLLVESRLGRGAVLLCSTSCDSLWSNLPTLPVFVPLMQQWVSHLALRASPQRVVSLGEPLAAVLDAQPSVKEAQVADPSGRLHRAAMTPQPDGKVHVSFDQTTQPGLYALIAGSQRMIYVVSSPPQESDLTPLPAERMKQLETSLGARRVTSIQERAALASQAGRGLELWHPILASVLALLLMELAFEQWITRERTA